MRRAAGIDLAHTAIPRRGVAGVSGPARFAYRCPMWTGTAVLRPGGALSIETAGDQAPYRDHAVQVAIGVAGPVASGRSRRAGASRPVP